MAPKDLALVRHAKSSWDNPEIADHDRPLNARGRRDAVLVGRYLRGAGLLPELVLCSSATRARQTLELLDLAPAAEVLLEEGLYGADARLMLDRLRTIAREIGSVLLIGHNPGMEDLARMLVDDGLESEEKFPTGAVAELSLPIQSWSELAPGVARLRTFVIPRTLD